MTAHAGAFIVRRVAAAALFVVAVSVAAIVLGRLAPGDAASDLVLIRETPASIAAERARLGLDRPIYEQVGRWFAGLARLDLGTSSAYDRPVRELVASHALSTAELAAAALGLALVLGLPAGVWIGARPRGVLAWVVTPLSIALVSCPPLIGAMALLLLGVATGWLSTAPGHLAVPVLALALPLAARLERLQSRATREALALVDVRAAAARGIPPARLLWVHAARQSLRPVLGVFGVILGGLFSGSLAVEVVTSWPGLGQLMYSALIARDVLLVTGCVLAGAVCLAIGNLIADLLRAAADPRVRET